MKQAMGIFGYGYTAMTLANHMASHGYHIMGTSRKAVGSQTRSHPNIELVNFSRTSAERLISECSAILVSTPPDEQGNDPVLTQFKTLLKASCRQLQWIGYLSSSGVYGHHYGHWVNEETLPANPGQKGIQRLKIETQYMALHESLGMPVHIFRLAGIYGPERNALQRILKGRNHTIYKPNHYFSRIHVDDISHALMASINNPTPGEIYNVCDDLPAPSHQVDEFAAKHLQLSLKRIPLEQANLSQTGYDFYQKNKRVSNQKIKNQLNLKLNYPTYKQGLLHILQTLPGSF